MSLFSHIEVHNAGRCWQCSAIFGSYEWFALQIAADNAIFGQTGPKVGSFDAGYGSSQMVRLIGEHLLCACCSTACSAGAYDQPSHPTTNVFVSMYDAHCNSYLLLKRHLGMLSSM